MKRVVFILLILGISGLIASCDEFLTFFNDPGSSAIESDAYRIKTIEYYNNDTINLTGREEFMYDDYNKVNLVVFSADMQGAGTLVDHGQSIFNYDGNTITQIYSMQGEDNSKTIYTMDGDKPIKSEESYKDTSGVWITETIIEYTYEQNLLKKEVYTDNNGAEMQVSGERTFQYENAMMANLKYSTDWWFDSTEVFTVVNEQVMYNSNEKLDSIHHFTKANDGSFVLTAREFFTYKNGRLIHRQYLYFNATTATWEESYSLSLRYNNDGFLNEMVRNYNNGASATKTSYEWETKAGNVGSFYGIQYYRYMGLQTVN